MTRSKPSSTNLGIVWLFRAQVCLPIEMCGPDVFDERLVFFESPSRQANEAYHHLLKLLDAAWNTDTSAWETDRIYNVRAAEMAIRDAFGDEATGDLRLLESGLGGATGVGPDRITYWRRAAVDVLTTPRVEASAAYE